MNDRTREKPQVEEASGSPPGNSVDLYDALAPDYDASFEGPTHRHAYDLLAGEYIGGLLPQAPALIVDAGCGTGRWAAHWLAAGHRVIGIEEAPAMIEALAAKRPSENFALIAEPMEKAEIEPASADLVVAMGSMQYARDPALMIRRFASWTKPSGVVCIYTDSLVALALELIRLGKTEESLTRLASRRGVFSAGGERAELALYDSATLKADFRAAGLVDIDCRGLLVTSSAWGKERCAEAMASAARPAFLDLERRLSAFPQLADVGRHIIASGRRPPGGAV